MTLNYSTPVVNPRLGSGFAIFASAYTCLVLMLVILEQLGLPAPAIDQLIVVTPAFFYLVIGFMTRTVNIEDFFAAGQRVPPFYNALALTSMVFGGSILLGSIGSFFFAGIDAIAILTGCFAGLVLMGVLFVPHLRKAGANTLPGFLQLRFGRNGVRLAASLLMIVPSAIILIAEIALGGKIAGYFLPLPQTLGISLAPGAFFTLLVCASVILTVVLGGMRSATWTQGAQFIVFLGILAPLVTVSVMRTNLPLPQLTYGSQLEELKSLEASRGLVTVSQPQPLSISLPGPAPASISRPSERAFSAFRPIDFVLLVFCLAAGVAAHPAFLPRLSTTPTILSSRRSFGWVAVIAAFAVLTIPAYAFFTKAMAVEALVGVPVPNLPAWSRILQQLGLISLPSNQFDPMNAVRGVAFQRDSLALILPVAGGLPRVFFGLAAASALAAMAACAAGHAVAIANTVSDDIFFGFLNKAASPGRRLLIARLTMLASGVFVFAVTQSQSIDSLRWVISAFSLSAGTFFAVLTLSVWWRRLTAAGALAGMASGFLVTALYLSAGGTPLFGIDPLTAAAAGVPVSFAASVFVSLFLGQPSEYALEAVDELRIPAGETLQSRALRLAARAKPPRPA
ncbi:MAG: sodium:solute symporter family transporter [Rhodomicrobium sp.]